MIGLKKYKFVKIISTRGPLVYVYAFKGTLDVAHEYKGYPWRWCVLRQTFCSDLPSRKYVR